MAGRGMSWRSAGVADYRMAPPAACRRGGGQQKARRIGRAPGVSNCSGLLALPDLRLADEDHAARHLELAAALDQFHLRLVHLALVGLEDGAAGIGVAVALHAADDLHPGDRLALAIVLALIAGRIGLAGIEQFDDAPAERAIGALRDLD